jgi:hypothetical protein
MHQMAERLLVDQEKMMANRKADLEHTQEMMARMDANTKEMLEKWTPTLKGEQKQSRTRQKDGSQYECLAERDDGRPRNDGSQSRKVGGRFSGARICSSAPGST